MIHVPHSTVSFETRPLTSPNGSFAPWTADELCGDVAEAALAAGEGIISGLRLRRTAVPQKATEVERRKPGLERSMRYQRTGLTRASVKETWRVEAQDNLR
jgi:hypothetical protein